MSKAKKPAYRKHLNSATDLVTKPEATRAGFVELALEKNRRATPFVDQGRRLQSAASQAPTIAALRTINEIRIGLETAAGVSDKARAYLEQTDLDDAVAGLITHYLDPAGTRFVEELVFRFLLIRGDTLGGSMRNAGGAMAQRKLARALISTLTLGGIDYRWRRNDSDTWTDKPDDDTGIEESLRGISWAAQSKTRTVLFNLKVPFVGKNGNNVDVCIFNRTPAEIDSDKLLSDKKAYVALGELKGGIDPAGADEHWKTANAALNRIRKAVPGIAAFFVGAAIENSMASEIWDELEDGTLTNAANLTDEDQVSSICRWLCDL